MKEGGLRPERHCNSNFLNKSSRGKLLKLKKLQGGKLLRQMQLGVMINNYSSWLTRQQKDEQLHRKLL